MDNNNKKKKIGYAPKNKSFLLNLYLKNFYQTQKDDF